MNRWLPLLLLLTSTSCDRLKALASDAGATTSPDPQTAGTATAPETDSTAAATATATVAAPVGFQVGDKVQGRWSDGLWYNGKITVVNADHTYNVKYNDGDVSNHLHADRVRVPKVAAGGGATTPNAGGGGSNANAPCPGPGLTRRCSGVCVNIQEDNNNCGSCGNRCPSGKHCDGHMSCRDANGEL